MVFAYNYASQQHARAPRIDPTPLGSGKGLTGLEGAGEAAAILRKASSLGKVAEAALRARYADKLTGCPCCDNRVPIPDWLGACKLLAAEVAVPAAPRCHERLALLLVMRHFLGKDDRASFETIAKRHGQSVDQVKRHNTKIGEALKRVESEAQGAISDLLIEAKLLPKS